MGQQQLILLVLATVIVGLAIVVGIQAFTENSNRSNADALMQDAVRIANDIQAWGQKPSQFGGPASGDDFTSVTWADMGYPSDGDETNGFTYTNLNGEFSLTPTAGASVLITGTKATEDDATVALNEVQVIVCGTESDEDIVGSVMTIGGETVSSTTPSCS